jgi:CheY-like chemotaxis protein
MSTMELRRFCAARPAEADILLVENDRASNDVYAKALRGAGFRVTQAHDGLEAWRALLSHPPHLVVTDLAVPGMDGVELCRRVRSIQKTASLPMITVTGLAGSSDRGIAAEAGFDEVLTKPCTPAALLDAIARALERSAERRARMAQRGRAAVRTPSNSTREGSEARERIRADYREMLGLRVTVQQGARLWNLPVGLCAALLEDLVAEGFLARSGDHYRLP